MDASTAAIIGAAVGSGVTGLFGFIAIIQQRRSEERRQIRELAVKAAIENWSRDFEISKLKGGDTLLQPLDLYLVHAMHLVAALDGRLKTPDEIRTHLRETYAATKAARGEIDDHNKTRQTDAA